MKHRNITLTQTLCLLFAISLIGFAAGTYPLHNAFLQDDLNANQHSITNAATINATNYLINGTNFTGGVGPQGPAGSNGTNGATGPQGPSGVVTATLPLVYNSGTSNIATTSMSGLRYATPNAADQPATSAQVTNVIGANVYDAYNAATNAYNSATNNAAAIYLPKSSAASTATNSASATGLNNTVISAANSTALGNTNNAPGGMGVVQPAVFYVNSYSNGVPNTKVIYDAVYTSGSTTLTSASANFTSSDVGKTIVLSTSTTARQITTISTVTNSTTVTLAATASSTRTTPTITGVTNASPLVITTSAVHGLSIGDIVYISGVGGNTAANGIFQVLTVPTTTTFTIGVALSGSAVNGSGAYTSGGTVNEYLYPVSYGTDNTTAIQSAITAAYNAGGGRVILDAGVYMVSSAPSNATGGNSNNSVFYVPQNGLTGCSIEIDGSGTPAFPTSAFGNAPAVSGTVIYCPNTTVSGSYPSVFASAGTAYVNHGPWGFGSTNLIIKGINIREPGNPKMTGVQWYKGAGLELSDFICDIDLPLPCTSVPNPSTGNAYGIICPYSNNQADVKLNHIYVGGFYIGADIGEHTIVSGGFLSELNYKGLSFSSDNYNYLHGSQIDRACIQWSVISLEFTDAINAGLCFTNIDELDTEEVTGANSPMLPSWAINTYTINDPNSYASGRIAAFVAPGGFVAGHGTIATNGASLSLMTIDLRNALFMFKTPASATIVPFALTFTGSANFVQAYSAIDASLTNGQVLLGLGVGTAASSNNEFYFAFSNAGGSGSSTNYGYLGLFGGSNLRITPTGMLEEGNIGFVNAGNTLSIKGGSNATSGTVTLSSGAATVSSTAITTSDVIIATLKTSSGTPGTFPPLATVTTGTITFTGLSTDNSTYNWAAIHANQ